MADAAARGLATRLRALPWPQLMAAVILLAALLTLVLQALVGFEDSKLDEVVALVGALLLGWPGLSLNASARRRSALDDQIAALLRKSGTNLTPAQQEALDADLGRLARKSSDDRLRSLDWSLGPELCLLGGYVAFLVASMGNLAFG